MAIAGEAAPEFGSEGYAVYSVRAWNVSNYGIGIGIHHCYVCAARDVNPVGRTIANEVVPQHFSVQDDLFEKMITSTVRRKKPRPDHRSGPGGQDNCTGYPECSQTILKRQFCAELDDPASTAGCGDIAESCVPKNRAGVGKLGCVRQAEGFTAKLKAARNVRNDIRIGQD